MKELAVNAPTSFYSKTNQLSLGGSNEFLECIIPILRDSTPLVRAAAADALAECVKLIIKKRHRSKTALLCKIYAGVMEGLVSSRKTTAAAFGLNEDTFIHGSLLAADKLLEHAKDFMLPRFDELCDAVIRVMDHPDALIRLGVVNLIPNLASRCPGVFGRRYSEMFLDFLITCSHVNLSRREVFDERPAALLAIGRLALVFKGDEYKDYFHSFDSRIDKIFETIRIGLGGSRNVAGTLASTMEALQCASDFVEAIGDRCSKYIPKMLDHMLSVGLSDALIHSLRAIATHIPSLKVSLMCFLS